MFAQICGIFFTVSSFSVYKNSSVFLEKGIWVVYLSSRFLHEKMFIRNGISYSNLIKDNWQMTFLLTFLYENSIKINHIIYLKAF